MQPATLRRLLVFGVCVAGVGALYLAPSTALAPDQVDGSAGRHDLPTASPPASPPRASFIPVTSTTPPTTAPAPPTARVTTAVTTASTVPTTTPPIRTVGTEPIARGRSGATAIRPGTDDVPPGPPGKPALVTADPQRLTVSWTAASDDLGVVSYQVWLNGFFVLATQRTSATLPWFNDTSTHVVQVRALDAAGNEGVSGPVLLVNRPAPEPTTTAPTAPSAFPAVAPTARRAPGSHSPTVSASPGTSPAGSPTPRGIDDPEEGDDG